MPSTYTQNLYHAVFSTKNRSAFITPDLELRLYPYIGGILKDYRCVPIAINGTEDHLHVLTCYPSDLSHSDMLRHVKQQSSAWIHETFPSLQSFAWQQGYGGFTVSKSALDDVATYIRNQKAHHERLSSLDEFLELLRRHGVDFDPTMLE